MEITYNQGSKLISHEFSKSLIEREYGITAKPSTSGNPTSNAILERIHQFLGNLERTFNIKKTYVDGNDPWLVILAAESFSVFSTKNSLRGYNAG